MSSQDSAPPADDGAAALRFRFVDVEFDEIEGQLRVAGRPVVVEPRPLRLLLELLRHVGEVVTKEELLDTVWEGRPTVDHVLANAVSKLRTALGEQGAVRLVTVPRVGYRLVGPVQRLPARAPEFVPQAGQPVAGREGYVLERPLGQGAHSDVWLARHAKLGQAHVFKFAADGARLSALKREYTLYRVLAQALGPRDDFTRVLDSNFTAAPYFIECSFGGQNLLEWAEDGGRLATLTTAQRIDLFVQVAAAVAAAHSVGVLHKDLKPGNVLVAAGCGAQAWQFRLTDFGSGRLLDAARLQALQLTTLGLTQTQAAVSDSSSGTLMYLAPELLAGQAPTVQSDVYALGLLLCQMVRGDLQQPMATGWQREVPDELLRDDIAAATEGNPDQRLEGAMELVKRLETLAARRLAQAAQAEQAKQAAQAAAALRAARARRPWVWAAMASLAVGLGISLLFQTRAEQALQAARAESQRAQTISDFLHRDVLESPDVVTTRGLRPMPLLEVLRRASKTAAERFQGQPRSEATVRRKLAETFLRMASLTDAVSELTLALSLLEPVADPADPELLMLRFLQVRHDAWTHKLDRAGLTLDAAERRAGATALAGHTELAMGAARARYDFLFESKRFAEALPAAERLVALSQRVNPRDLAARLEATQRLIEVHYRMGHQAAVDALMAEVAAPPFNAQRLNTEFVVRQLVDAAQERIAAADGDGAEKLLLQARTRLEKEAEPNDFYMAFLEMDLGSAYDIQGRHALALAQFNRALPLFHRSVGADHQYVRVAELNIANALMTLSKAHQALPLYQSLLAWMVARPQAPWGGYVRFGLATALIDVGRADEGLNMLNVVTAADIERGTAERDWAWKIKAERGRAMVATGQRSAGLALLGQAVDGMAAAGTWPWVVGRYRQQLAALQKRP